MRAASQRKRRPPAAGRDERAGSRLRRNGAGGCLATVASLGISHSVAGRRHSTIRIDAPSRGGMRSPRKDGRPSVGRVRHRDHPLFRRLPRRRARRLPAQPYLVGHDPLRRYGDRHADRPSARDRRRCGSSSLSSRKSRAVTRRSRVVGTFVEWGGARRGGRAGFRRGRRRGPRARSAQRHGGEGDQGSRRGSGATGRGRHPTHRRSWPSDAGGRHLPAAGWQVADWIAAISAAGREQSSGIEQVNAAVTQMD